LTLLLLGMLMLAFNISQVSGFDSWVWVRDTVTGAYGEAVVGTGTALYIARGTKFYWTCFAAYITWYLTSAKQYAPLTPEENSYGKYTSGTLSANSKGCVSYAVEEK